MKPMIKRAVAIVVVAASLTKARSFVKEHSKFQKPFHEKRYGLLGTCVERWKDEFFDFAWNSGYHEGFGCGVSASPEDVEEYYKEVEEEEEAELAAKRLVA